MSVLFEAAHLWLPGMLGLILASGFFSGSETALFFLSHDELRVLRTGGVREKKVVQLLSDPDRLLTAVLFWNLAINLTYFAVSVVVAQRLAAAGENVAAGVFTLASLFAIILFGEVLPKSLAVVFRRSLVTLVSLPLTVAVRLADPITPALGRVARVVRRTFWPEIGREPALHADDLDRAVEASHESDDVIRQERQVLHNILDLSELTAEEVMRPRGTYISLPPPVHLEDLKGEVPAGDYLLIQEPGSEDIDRVVVLTSFSSIPRHNLEDAAEDVVYVPWCANLADILQLLRDRFCSLAVVVNEYGETIGIIIYEDLIDTILTPQASRTRRLFHREPILQIAPDCYHVEGITTLRYLAKALGIDYEPESDRLVTVAGMLHDELEHIPVVGDECEWQGYHIRVIDILKRGQLRVMVSRNPEAEETTDDG
jgi:putative hemolysin